MKRSIYLSTIAVLFLLICTFSCQKKKPEIAKEKSKYEINLLLSHKDSIKALVEFNADIKDDKLQLIKYGPPPSLEDRYYWLVLQNNYNIGIKKSLGCMVNKGDLYYNDLMSREITNKYGLNFFEIVNRKADSIARIDQPLINYVEKLNIISRKHLVVSMYDVHNTTDENIKVVCGLGWVTIKNKDLNVNMFRIVINRHTKKIISSDLTTYIE